MASNEFSWALLRVVTSLFVMLLPAAATSVERELFVGSPEMPPTHVDSMGVVHAEWGSVAVALSAPEGAGSIEQLYRVDPVPTVVTRTEAEGVTLEQTVYRAPIWPDGVDVLTARVENADAATVDVRLTVQVPGELSAGRTRGMLAGRAVLGLPLGVELDRPRKPWGHAGGAVALRGWAKPARACDTAFRHIRAGMGGVPIEYEFALSSGGRRKVVLGLCESHWAVAGRRPLDVRVEGAPSRSIDPVAAWGQHVPGGLVFDAADEDGDGYLRLAVEPPAVATDKNTILNVVWVFPADTEIDLETVLRGERNDDAERYVDVGGDRDQSLFEEGPFFYELKLAAGASRSLMFLLAAPGGTVPDPEKTAWTPKALAQAARDVWRDWFAQGKGLLAPTAGAKRLELADILLARAQADGFFAALSRVGDMGSFSFEFSAKAVAALDAAGIHDEARRLLRGYWDRPVPRSLAVLAQTDDGSWSDTSGDPTAQGAALKALASHALATSDRRWAEKVWPALRAGADWLGKTENVRDLSADARRVARAGLDLVIAVARDLLERPEEAPRLEEIAQRLD